MENKEQTVYSDLCQKMNQRDGGDTFNGHIRNFCPGKQQYKLGTTEETTSCDSKKLIEIYTQQFEKLNQLTPEKKKQFQEVLQKYIGTTKSEDNGYTQAIDQTGLESIFNEVCVEFTGPFYFYRVEKYSAVLYKSYIQTATLNDRYMSVSFRPGGAFVSSAEPRVRIMVPKETTVKGVFTGFLNELEPSEIILESNLVCQLETNHVSNHVSKKYELDNLKSFYTEYENTVNKRYVATIKITPERNWKLSNGSPKRLAKPVNNNDPPHAPRNTSSPQPSGGPSSQSKPVNPAVLAASVVFWAMVVNQYYTRKKRNVQEGLSKPSIRLSQRAGARRHRRTHRRFRQTKTTKL